MERSAAASMSSAFVRWEEVYVSSDKGRREVHYYLKRRNGTSDLAVIGREKSLRHMSYHYAIRDRSLLSISPSSSLLKLRSRREVIDWLNSIIPDSHHHQSSQPVGGSVDSKDVRELDVETLKDVQLRKLGHHTTEFLWLGSPWTCRKRRRHYQSFRRNGVKISLHDFVYVLAEEDKRLVAYLDDIYEDSRGKKMVVVQWFHKIDEVGIVLPHNFNDREIFFSLCLQDLSIECIDGLATVLSPQHYEKFLNEAAHTQLEPFVCHRQFDNEDIKPFDITKVKGYWKQEIIISMLTSSPSNAPIKSQPPNDGLKVEGYLSDAFGIRPKKRLRRSKDGDLYLHSASKQESTDACLDTQNFGDNLICSKDGIEMCSVKESCVADSFSGKEVMMQKPSQHLTIGSQVEVLSQDSGIRGCWFRALIIKKHKDKVKVQYQDIKDAADEANNLEEWVLASRVAVPDELSLRISGRTTVRPIPLSNKGRVSGVVNVGTVVDVWWLDGWWEGIVVEKGTEDRFHVYFPGEKWESVFGHSDLRHSQEWLGNGWNLIKERPDVVTSLLSGLDTKLIMVKPRDGKLDQATICDKRRLVSIIHKDSLSIKDKIGCINSQVDSVEDKVKEVELARDLTKDELLAQLKWKTSKKRRQRGNSVKKLHCSGNKNEVTVGMQTCESFFIPTSLKVDHDNCKYIGDSLFSSSVVPPLTSLVMSR
uniref:BAH domain-containing protein n=1 Tax=Davidia involucrata TaxID=16924 RepID=A0A5B6ZQB1_DAVIN